MARRLSSAALAALLLAAFFVMVRAADAPAAPNTFVEVPTDNGAPVEIALNVRMPDNYVPGQKYPTLFEMSGYDGGSAEDGTLAKDYGIPQFAEDSRQLSRRFNGEYVTIHASARGTGCSGGEFDLFSVQTAKDGAWIIDNWIVEQSWSDKQVALMGHSYGGITGFMIAAQRPKHLKVATLSGLTDDLYRGLVYPGGVSDFGFPLAWTMGIRPFYDVGGGIAPGVLRDEQADDGDPDDPYDRRAACAENVAHKQRTVVNEPAAHAASGFDNEWFATRALVNYASEIKVPLHITGAYQDEQTGPRGQAHLFELATKAEPRRLLLTNGDHGTQNPGSTGHEVYGDRKAFVDHFTGVGRSRKYQPTSVRVLFEYHRPASGTEQVSNAALDDAAFPLSVTQWQDWHLQPDGSLSPAVPAGTGSFPYVSGSTRQSWSYQGGYNAGPPFTTADGPDQAMFTSAPFEGQYAIAGPVTATLHLSTTAPDTDLFVSMVDIAPDGARTYLQRGLLRASHRAIDPSHPLHRPYRPYRAHTLESLQPVVPGEINEYVIEVFPVGHVFRPGHQLGLIVHTPPQVDSYYAYVPARPPGVNTIHVGPGQLSRLTLPMVPLPAIGAPAPPCGSLDAVRCVPKPNG